MGSSCRRGHEGDVNYLSFTPDQSAGTSTPLCYDGNVDKLHHFHEVDQMDVSTGLTTGASAASTCMMLLMTAVADVWCNRTPAFYLVLSSLHNCL